MSKSDRKKSKKKLVALKQGGSASSDDEPLVNKLDQRNPGNMMYQYGNASVPNLGIEQYNYAGVAYHPSSAPYQQVYPPVVYQQPMVYQQPVYQQPTIYQQAISSYRNGPGMQQFPSYQQTPIPVSGGYNFHPSMYLSASKPSSTPSEKSSKSSKKPKRFEPVVRPDGQVVLERQSSRQSLADSSKTLFESREKSRRSMDSSRALSVSDSSKSRKSMDQRPSSRRSTRASIQIERPSRPVPEDDSDDEVPLAFQVQAKKDVAKTDNLKVAIPERKSTSKGPKSAPSGKLSAKDIYQPPVQIVTPPPPIQQKKKKKSFFGMMFEGIFKSKKDKSSIEDDYRQRQPISTTTSGMYRSLDPKLSSSTLNNSESISTLQDFRPPTRSNSPARMEFDLGLDDIMKKYRDQDQASIHSTKERKSSFDFSEDAHLATLYNSITF